MKTERPKNAQPNYGSSARRPAESPRGTSQQKKARKEEQNGGDTKELEISSGPAQPKMKNDIVKRRRHVLSGAGNKQRQRFLQRLRSGIESPGFIIDHSEIIIGGHQS